MTSRLRSRIVALEGPGASSTWREHVMVMCHNEDPKETRRRYLEEHGADLPDNAVLHVICFVEPPEYDDDGTIVRPARYAGTDVSCDVSARKS